MSRVREEVSFRALLEKLQAGRSTKAPTRSRCDATELAVNPLTLSLVISGEIAAAVFGVRSPLPLLTRKHQPESQPEP